MKSNVLKTMNVEEAKALQFKLVDIVCKNLHGFEMLTLGDLGVHPSFGKPNMTHKVEAAIAEFFETEAACLVVGAGTGAIRFSLASSLIAGNTLLVHTAAIYPTTKQTIELMNLKVIRVNFNHLHELREVLKKEIIHGVLLQYSRQSLHDTYDMCELISVIRSLSAVPILVDDNYTALKVHQIGVQCGADLSSFSAFKLQGPEGIGIIVGKKKYIEKIENMKYSGGSQVQGFQALEVLRGLVNAPVSLAIQGEQVEKLFRYFQDKKIEGIKKVVIANTQSKVLLVEFDNPIAEKVLSIAETMGAAPYPIGAESKYELCPMFYRISSTLQSEDDDLVHRMIRINPMRSSAETVIRILLESLKGV